MRARIGAIGGEKRSVIGKLLISDIDVTAQRTERAFDALLFFIEIFQIRENVDALQMWRRRRNQRGLRMIDIMIDFLQPLFGGGEGVLCMGEIVFQSEKLIALLIGGDEGAFLGAGADAVIAPAARADREGV